MNKKIKNKIINTNKGITLIALIITIIVLLILAMVAIRAVTGNGILDYAKKAKEEYGLEQLKDNVNLVLSGRKITKETGGTLNDLKEDLETIQGATVEKAENGVYYVTKAGNTVTVYEDGEVSDGKVMVWDGTTSEVPEIKEFNWYIYNGGQLKFLADFVNNENSLTEEQKTLVAKAGYNESDVTLTTDTIVYLMEDIDLGARQENGKLTKGVSWTPIGNTNTTSKNFVATFEGNNHTIQGIYVYIDGQFAGLFGVLRRNSSKLNYKK